MTPATLFGTILITLGSAQGAWFAWHGPTKKSDGRMRVLQWPARLIPAIAYALLLGYAVYVVITRDAVGYILIFFAVTIGGQGVWDLRTQHRRVPNLGLLLMSASFALLGISGLEQWHSRALIISSWILIGCAALAWIISYFAGDKPGSDCETAS